jgi:hypothetical protein
MQPLNHPSKRRITLALAATLLLAQCKLPEYWLAHVGNPGAQSGSQTIKRAEASGSRPLFAQPTSFNVPKQASGINDAARVLAGLPADGSDEYTQVRKSAAWVSHKAKLDNLWKDFEWRHHKPIQEWQGAQDLQKAAGLFYPFSGPDFLFANLFFPNAETYVLAGLEPCEPLPPLANLSESEMTNGLDGLVTSISTAMQFSFFITKDMRRDLVSTRFRGVLPLILTFMARTGHTVESINLVRLDASGSPVVVSGDAPGVMVRGHGPDGKMRRVLYFRQDLSDDGLNANSPILKLADSLGAAPAFLKSASYLMHESGFNTIRHYLLTKSAGIVQCPSGVPYRRLQEYGWKTSLYGNYRGTLDIFSSHHQPDLIAAYTAGKAEPLSFGVGYLFEPNRTCLMVARK